MTLAKSGSIKVHPGFMESVNLDSKSFGQVAMAISIIKTFSVNSKGFLERTGGMKSDSHQHMVKIVQMLKIRIDYSVFRQLFFQS